MTSEPRPKRRAPFVLSLATMGLIVLVAGCSGSDRTDGEERESGPDQPAAPAAGGMVEEVLRFGALDGDGPEVFGEIRALATTPGGDILVFDHFGNELRRFDREGEHLHSLGTTGEGPGEFLHVLAMPVAPSGDVWVVDARNRRISIVRDSSVVRTLARPSRVVVRSWVGGFDESGHMHELAVESQGPGLDLADLMLRLDEDGTVASEHPLPRVSIPTPTLGGGVGVAIPFRPSVLRAWDPAGAVWQATSSDYHVVRIDLTGDTTAVVALEEPGPPLDGAEQDSLNQAIASSEELYGIEVTAEMTPDRIPVLRWITVDDQANLWVCATARDPCDELHVHDPESGLHRVVNLPVPLADEPVPQIRDGLIYGVTEGAMGEPQVFVGRVPPG